MKKASIKYHHSRSRIGAFLSLILMLTFLIAAFPLRSSAYIVYSDTMNRAVFTITTDSHAGGWEKATFKVEYVDSQNRDQAKQWDITAEMKKGDKITLDLFESFSKPKKMSLYLHFGGGFTIRKQSGKITYAFQKKTLREVEYTAWSAPFSSYDKEVSYQLPAITPVELTLSNGWSKEMESLATAIGEAGEEKKATVKLMSNAEIMDNTIEVPLACDLTIDLNGYAITRKYSSKDYAKGELFHIGRGATLTIIDSAAKRNNGISYNGNKYQGGTLYGCKSDSGGCCFYIEAGGTLSMTGGVIADCASDSNNGGAILCAGKMTLNGVRFVRCTSGYYGGAIAITETPDVSMENVNFENCEASDGGAVGVYQVGADFEIDKIKNCTFKNCKAKYDGGGLYLSVRTRFSASALTFYQCEAERGGGVYNGCKKPVTLSKSKIEQCSASKSGGGLYYYGGGAMTLNSVEVKNCKSKSGGGMYLLTPGSGSEIRIDHGDIHHCTADQQGGGLYIYDDGKDTDETNKTVVTDTAIHDNRAELGGGVYAESYFVYLIGDKITGNQATGKNGGGIYVDSMRDIEVAGEMVIRDNNADGRINNLCLQNGNFSSAKLYSGGLYDGSYIGISTTSNSKATVGKHLSQYQVSKYLHADESARALTMTDIEKVKTPFLASMMSEQASIAIIACGGAAIAGSVGILYVRKRRREGKQSDEA